MDSFAVAAGSAFWLGLLTSISPCPLAANIAAMSFISRRMGTLTSVWLSGLFYTAGRVLSYSALSVLIVAGLLSIPGLSFALQRYAPRLLGPLLILVGLFLLEWLKLPSFGDGWVLRLQTRVSGNGFVGAVLLGMIFALSFCPISAALFFGSLIPLAVAQESRWVLPAIYGLGTGLPVAAFALAIAAGARGLASAFEQLQRLEVWARRITGGVFILIGFYYGVLR